MAKLQSNRGILEGAFSYLLARDPSVTVADESQSITGSPIKVRFKGRYPRWRKRRLLSAWRLKGYPSSQSNDRTCEIATCRNQDKSKSTMQSQFRLAL